jgi:CheY-like chemotaxis protein
MKSKLPILLIEDDQVDAMTVMRSFKDLKITNELVHKINGVEGLDYLNKNQGKHPCLILLDLNMPRMNGIEFLQKMKDTEFKKIPVVVLTTSNEEKDKVESFKLGVAGYMLKPVNYQQFVDVMREINVYWTLSELPD